MMESIDVRAAQSDLSARPAASSRDARSREVTCSVVIPCYNEVENIANAIRRIPPMGCQTEIIVAASPENLR